MRDVHTFSVWTQCKFYKSSGALICVWAGCHGQVVSEGKLSSSNLIWHFFFVPPPPFLSLRRKTIQVYMGRVRVEVCPFRRIDEALPQTHGSQAVQVCRLWPQLFPFGSLGVAPPEAHARLKKKNVTLWVGKKEVLRAGSLLTPVNSAGLNPILMALAQKRGVLRCPIHNESRKCCATLLPPI